MCGIAGVWNLNGAVLSENSLRTFTDSIRHRGPDGAGYNLFNNNTLGFGHRRLSILDLTDAGKQPMFNEEQNLVISYNGEVYNFLEIRKELEIEGFKFITDTDTEVILNAYRKWGLDCLNRFNGMFAIAIWDFKLEELLLIRDRFGIKPLYFLHLPHQLFAFCSETLGFKYLDGFKREINDDLFQLALKSPEILEGSDKTIFKSIYQLLPGHFLRIRKNDAPLVTKWWDTENSLRPVPASYNEQVEEFSELFGNACKLRMRSDVTLASALSGGLDSSSVYSTLYKINSTNSGIDRIPESWQQAFVATFPGTTVNERTFAEKVVNHVNGNAFYIEPNYENLVNDIIESTRLLDGIISTPIISITDIYKAMRAKGVVVSMDGHGVDEMLYGYSTYVLQAFYDALATKDFKLAREYVGILSGLSPAIKIDELNKIIQQANRSVFERGLSFIKRKVKINTTTVNSKNPYQWLKNTEPQIINDLTSHYKAPPGWSASEKLMYNDFHYKSLPINLRDFDRASMQNGVEIRMPFMDYRLVSFVFSLPISSKVGHGFTKRILRDAMKKTLPEDIRTRTLKIGIGAPMEEWFRNNLNEYIFDTIHSHRFANSPYWNGKQMAEDIEKAYQNNTLDKSLCQKIWTIINANIILK